MCVCVCVCGCVRVGVCMYVCMYACMYVCMYVCMYACMHACMHGCVCVRVYRPCIDLEHAVSGADLGGPRGPRPPLKVITRKK